ncbi:cupin domain-containing protein [Ramlibacter sp. PS4R-6]|uniref:cupin domain-containing protein n=1 Tax=Ramlibacter sp. PS4R-6 TaxID=3133438 RepID=UPI0030A96E21
MVRSLSHLVLSCAGAAALALSSPAWAAHGGEGLKWGDAPPVLPKGAKLAVLHGDPTKPGPFVMRLQVPAGYKVAPHWHSKDENVTVMSGAFMVGMGDKPDVKAMKTFKAGDFGSIPAKQKHYAMAKTAAIIQIHGDGPFDLTYVNADDDPAKMTKAKK